MNRGHVFERQLRLSCPKWASVINIPSPTPPPREFWGLTDADGKPTRLGDLVLAAGDAFKLFKATSIQFCLAAELAFQGRPEAEVESAREWSREVQKRREQAGQAMRPLIDNGDKIKTAVDRMRAIDKPPFDFLLQAPGLHRYTLSVAIECKSVAQSRLPFDAVKDHQREGLENAARRGLAGVAIEFSATEEAWYVPIGAFLEADRTAKLRSLSALDCQAIGTPIEIDHARGRTHRYYRLDRFLASLGALVPEGEVIPEQARLLEVS